MSAARLSASTSPGQSASKRYTITRSKPVSERTASAAACSSPCEPRARASGERSRSTIASEPSSPTASVAGSSSSTVNPSLR